MPTPTDDATALIRHGWHVRATNPRQLCDHARHMRAVADDDRWRAWADLFEAWGQLAQGDRPAGELALASAARRFGGLQDAEGEIVCRGIQADLWIRDGAFDAAHEFCITVLAQAGDSLSSNARCNLMLKLVTALEQLGRYDDALRMHYESIAIARRAGAPAVLATALGQLGGFQASLMNHVDALPLCDEAWQLCADAGWTGVTQLVGTNRMSVLSELGRHDEASAMALRLIDSEAGFPARHRDTRFCLYGAALARSGRFELAQICLDRCLAERDSAAPTLVSWVWTQAHIWNRTGRSAQALALLQPLLGSGASSLPDSFPVDRAYLYGEAALACEALDDAASALGFERISAQARVQAMEQAAHTRRLTLQIAYDLDAAHRQRDSALREQERATQEQQRLGELNAALQAANDAKTRFLAAASHDLRQPVQALTMTLTVLQRERSAPKRRALIERMDQSLHALRNMFDVLLDMSRLDAGLVQPHVDAVPLDELLARLVDEHAPQAGERGLGLRLHRPRNAPRAGTCSDAVLLEGCLRNLIDNALKYTPRGGVVVRLRDMAPAVPAWRIEVHDTGPGIDPALQARVFEEFFQVGNEERDRNKGLGLGLSIVRRTAALLGHPLGLRSTPGRGCCFSLEVSKHVLDGPAKVDAVDAEPGTDAALGLIVIDDDEQVRESLAALLTMWGHRVSHAADPDAAVLQWHRDGRPRVDAAIVDLRLRGGRDGLDAIARLRGEFDAGLPTLVMTGDTAPDRLRALADAQQPWLAKPIMPMRLRSWLQGLVR